MENREDNPLPVRETLIYRSEGTHKQFLPIYLSRIQEHYESYAPREGIPILSPLDFQRKWKTGSYNDRELKSAIKNISPSVVCVSYFSGVQRKVDCSGFIIAWDDAKGIATVLTSAKLMRSPSKRDNYYIVVRLANGKILLAEEHYVDYYHNIVTFKVYSDAKLKPLELYSPPLQTLEGVEVVALARDFYTCKLSESSGLIHDDYPYFGCEHLVSSTCSSSEAGEGGPLINRMGHVYGINFFDGHQCVHPLPSSVINSCLKNWNSYGIVMQPWFGFKVINIATLPTDAYETLPECWGDSTVVVNEVYEGSPADKVGVRPGDSITAVNQNPVCCPHQYADLLTTESDMLTACHPNKTDNMVFVSVNDHPQVVLAENLSVDDKKFCSSWLGDESDWTFMEPLIGSQKDPAYDIGINTNISFEPLGFVTDITTDTGMDDDVPSVEYVPAWRFL